MLVSTPGWIGPSAEVSGRVTTHTNADGLWQLELTPSSAYEVDAVYRVVEECTGAEWFFTVPEPNDAGDPVWLRDVLVNPPDPDRRWRPLQKLADLHDVDRASIAAAQPGDYLVKLANGKWGAGRGSASAIELVWSPDPEVMLRVGVTATGLGEQGGILDWGDGSTPVPIQRGESVTHTYAEVGTYPVQVADAADPGRIGTATVTVKDSVPEAWAFLNGDDPWEGLVWVDEPADDTQYRVEWGDGTSQIVRGQQKVPPRPRVPHQYSEVGQYRVTVTDLSSKRSISGTLDIGEIGVLLTYDEPVQPRVWAKWLHTGATWRITWGASEVTTGTVPASGQVTQLCPVQLATGEHEFLLEEIVDGELRRSARRVIRIPTPWDWRMAVDMTWTSNPDRTSQNVTITPTGARSTCTVDWGDGSPIEQVAPNGSLVHSYGLPVPEAGHLLVITETETDTVTDPRRFSRLLAAPRYLGQPLLNARGRRAVDIDVAGVDGPTNNDWYRVSWGDGSTNEGNQSIDEVGALGRWYPATHYYQTDGYFSVTVDGPGMPDPVSQGVWVTVYPSPTISVTEELDESGQPVDPTRMTVRATVDNTESGGPCHVDVGDGSSPVACAERDSFTHQYPAAGRYVLVASSDADPSAQDRIRAYVPFGGGRTLYYELTQGDTDYDAVITLTSWDKSKSVWINWGDDVVDEVPATTGTKTHSYPPFSGTYPVWIYYGDESERYGETLTIPWGS